MKVIKQTAEYIISQKRSGRYAVTSADGSAINAEEKTKILLAEELIKLTEPKAAEPEAEEAPAE
ncbi:hypothetical protein A9Q89_04905 [Gammaproteobacteria bacterium 53_120_T64]|nr:hypothetical protein A9Q89_04905 [Gammaproteobacteria bacterium 53_120_T64]